jgi:hypothetical protein
MEGTERDSTQDWLLPEGSAPPLLADLELRIDEALAIARASEKAVGVVGAAALDAAKQARLAAEMAERASRIALRARRMGVPSQTVATDSQEASSAPAPASVPTRSTGPGDPVLRGFSERADRVMARLRALERRPRRPAGSSAAAGHRRPGG